MIDKPADICRDLDADCFAVENKHLCWLQDMKRGYCPWLQRCRMFSGKLLSVRSENHVPVLIHEDGRAEFFR